MRRPLAIGAATIAVALSFGLAACGSDDDSGDDSDALTKTELIAQADKICKQANDDLVKKSNDAFGNERPSDAEIVSFISDEIVPLYQTQVEDLRALTPDEADADDWNNIVDTFESEVQTVADDPNAAKDSKDPFTESSEAADEFGLTECGSN